MTILLYKKLAPITFRIGFLNCSFAKVREAFVQWKRQHFQSLESKDVSQPLESALLELEPLTPIPRRWLLMPTAGDWVAYFDNGQRGPDPVPVIGYLAEQLECRGLVATCIPHTLSQELGTKPGLYGAVQFELLASRRTNFLNYERTVSVAYEAGKWRFDATGAVQVFEDTTRYQKKRIVDRFTPEMLKSYCYALGVHIDNPSFYQSPALLISVQGQLPTGHPTLSLAQAQQEMGLLIGESGREGKE